MGVSVVPLKLQWGPALPVARSCRFAACVGEFACRTSFGRMEYGVAPCQGKTQLLQPQFLEATWSRRKRSTRQRRSLVVSAGASHVEDLQVVLSEVQSMRAGAIKKELDSFGVSYADCFEKADLVRRLAEVRVRRGNAQAPSDGAGDDSDRGRKSSQENATKEWKTRAAISSMPMRLIRSSPREPREYIVVQFEIGGQGPFDFVLDTACSTTMVTPRLAYKRLGISESSGKMTRGMGGMGSSGSEARQVSLPEVSLGSFSLGSMEAVVLDLSYTGLDPTIFGIVGLNFLSKFDIDFDFANRMISFYEAGAAARGQIAMQGLAKLASANLSFGLPAIQVAINSGPPEVAILDMGSPLSLINWAAAQRAELTPDSPAITRDSLSVIAIGGGGGQMASGVIDVSLVVDNKGSYEKAARDRITFQKTQVAVGNLPALDMLQAGMIVGLQLFNNARLVACFRENAFFLRGGIRE